MKKKPDIRARFIRPSLAPQKLTHFLAVYETGVFSVAAADVGVTQQAISKSIARLEDSLGVILFERHPTGVAPTIFAHTLAKRARAIISETKLAAAELVALRGAGKGFVRIGLGWTFLPRLGPELIERFKRANPDVTVSILTGESRQLYAALLIGDVEFVASAPPADMPADPMIQRRPLFVDRDQLVMRADHPLANRNDQTLEDFRDQTWMISLQLSQQWKCICDTFLKEQLEPPPNFVDLNSVILLKSMLLSTDGVALLSPELVSLPHEQKLYHAISEHPFALPRKAYLATRKNADMQALTRQMLTIFDQVWCEMIDESLHCATSTSVATST